MWLLNTTTLELREFSNVPRGDYAILSHVWQPDDKTYNFQSIRDIYEKFRGSEEGAVTHAPDKVRAFCILAAGEGYEWGWLDTCCIDKTSSAELSEAINSMYAWYEAADLCYVYLYDVPDDDNPFEPDSAFRSSKYHERGWTLQELLAQKQAVFLSASWRLLGRKSSLLAPLVERTGIDGDILLRKSRLKTASVAQRMSWAAHRVTTRDEDRAYSLMGIFGVAMPIIYGEGGERAFLRLQKEIIAICPDQSIFAWGSIHPDLDSAYNAIQLAQACNISSELAEQTGRNLLAKSPSDFAHSASMRRLDPHWFLELSGHTVEHKCAFSADGITLYLPISSHFFRVKEQTGYVHEEVRVMRAAALACTTTAETSKRRMTSITLLFLSGSPDSFDGRDDFSRVLLSDGVGLLAQDDMGEILLDEIGSGYPPRVVTSTYYRGATLQLGATVRQPPQPDEQHGASAPLRSFHSVRDDFRRRELRVQPPDTFEAMFGAAAERETFDIESQQSFRYVIEIPNWVFDRFKNRYGFISSPSPPSRWTLHNAWHVIPPTSDYRQGEAGTFDIIFVNATSTETIKVVMGALCDDKRPPLSVRSLRPDAYWVLEAKTGRGAGRMDAQCHVKCPPFVVGAGRLQVFFTPADRSAVPGMNAALWTYELLPEDGRGECGRAHLREDRNAHFAFPIRAGSADEAARRVVHIWCSPSYVPRNGVSSMTRPSRNTFAISMDLTGFQKV